MQHESEIPQTKAESPAFVWGAVNLRTYIHMLPDSHERAMRAIDGRLFKLRPISHAT